VGLGGKFKMY